MEARTHITSLCLQGGVCPLCEPDLHVAGCLYVQHSYSTCTHKSVVCVCVEWLNRGILSVSQDNAGSDSKPLLLSTFCLACCLASLLSLCSICSAGMRILCPDYVYQNVPRMCAVCVHPICVVIGMYVYATESRTESGEE